MVNRVRCLAGFERRRFPSDDDDDVTGPGGSDPLSFFLLFASPRSPGPAFLRSFPLRVTPPFHFAWTLSSGVGSVGWHGSYVCVDTLQRECVPQYHLYTCILGLEWSDSDFWVLPLLYNVVACPPDTGMVHVSFWCWTDSELRGAVGLESAVEATWMTRILEHPTPGMAHATLPMSRAGLL